MDPNQTTQPPVPPEVHSSYKIVYIVVGLLSLIVLIAVALPFTLNMFKGGTLSSPDKKAVAEDTKVLNNYRGDTSLESQQAYAQAADKRLADASLSNGARNLILLRKAAVISQARGDATSLAQKVAEATKTYLDFINVKNPLPGDLYFRDFAIVAVTRLQVQCCQVASDLMTRSPLFETAYNTYVSSGYSKSLSALLSLDDATRQLSDARKADAMNELNSMDLATKILSGYSNLLKPETKARLIKELGDGLASYPSLKMLTFNDPSVAFEAGNKLAIAYDFYKSLSPGGSTAAVNKEIDRQYEDAAASLNTAMSRGGDKHGLNEVLFYNQIYYVESLDRRYGSAVDTTKKNAAIATILHIIQTEPAITDVAKLYFQGQEMWKSSNPDEWKKLGAYTHFVSLGKANADIAAYLKSINVTP